MRDVIDPELGINVVDLGLVYGVTVDAQSHTVIDMTLTSAACPLTDVIEDQARQALTGGPGPGLVDDIRINWVWMPPWGPDKITEDGREQLRAIGFNLWAELRGCPLRTRKAPGGSMRPAASIHRGPCRPSARPLVDRAGIVSRSPPRAR